MHILTYKLPRYKFFLYFLHEFDVSTRQNQLYIQSHIVGWFDSNVALPIHSIYQLNLNLMPPPSIQCFGLAAYHSVCHIMQGGLTPQ